MKESSKLTRIKGNWSHCCAGSSTRLSTNHAIRKTSRMRMKVHEPMFALTQSATRSLRLKRDSGAAASASDLRKTAAQNEDGTVCCAARLVGERGGVGTAAAAEAAAAAVAVASATLGDGGATADRGCDDAAAFPALESAEVGVSGERRRLRAGEPTAAERRDDTRTEAGAVSSMSAAHVAVWKIRHRHKAPMA